MEKSTTLKEDKVKYDFKYPMVFKLKILIILFLILITFLCLTISYKIALIPALIIVYTSETHSGILLNLESKQYTDYQSIFGYKRGNWQSLASYPILTIKMVTGAKKYRRLDGFVEVSIRNVGKHFDLLLADVNHRKTIFLKSFRNEEEAIDFAKRMEYETDLVFQSYNPKISAATQARKRKSRYR